LQLLSDLIYATNFMTGCLLYLIEIYLCCEVGHKIKKQARNFPAYFIDYYLSKLRAHRLGIVCNP
jgi:hypothetical protein